MNNTIKKREGAEPTGEKKKRIDREREQHFL